MKSAPKNILTAIKMKYKEVWNFLLDQDIVRYNLSIKIKHRDLSESKTISMDYERAPDGSWMISTPTNENHKEFHAREILQAELLRIEENVRNYIVENELETDWKEQVVSLDKALASGLSADDLQYHSEHKAISVGAYFAVGYKAHFGAPLLATAYAKEATEALARNDLEHSSYCVNRGLHWTDPQILIPDPKKRFVERARLGGFAKDLHREPVKQRVAELLVSMAPNEGWSSIDDALLVVANYLIDNESKFVEGCKLQTHALPQVSKEWISRNPERFVIRLKSET